jgi:predicted nuclease with TOPRIM domain
MEYLEMRNWSIDHMKWRIEKSWDWYNELAEKVEKLEKERDLGIQRIKKLEEKLSKIPHKCPNCDGRGEDPIKTIDQTNSYCTFKLDALGRMYKECRSCGGEGIVWSS